MATESSIMKQLGISKTPTKAQIEQIPVIKYKGVEYLLRSKKGSGGLIFELFAKIDDTFKSPLGEITINPATGNLSGSIPVFKI